jgi:hypothetical protein
MSGGGLWRVYFTEDEKEAKIAGTMLCGVVSWRIDDTQLACQGWDRIDQGLVPAVLKRVTAGCVAKERIAMLFFSLPMINSGRCAKRMRTGASGVPKTQRSPTPFRAIDLRYRT